MAITTNTSQVDSLNSQISKLNEQVVSLTNQLNDTKKNQDSANAKQQQVLKNQIASLTNQLNATRSYYTYSTAHETVNSIKLAAANRKVNELQKKVTDLQNMTAFETLSKTDSNGSTKGTITSPAINDKKKADLPDTATGKANTDNKMGVTSASPTDVPASNDQKGIFVSKTKAAVIKHSRQDPDGSIQMEIDQLKAKNADFQEQIVQLKIKQSNSPVDKEILYTKQIAALNYKISNNVGQINHDQQQLDKI